MRDVRTIITLPFHDEPLGPDQLFGRTQLHRYAENFSWHRIRKPIVVDFADPISRAEDDIDDVMVAENFSEPMRETQFGAISMSAAELQHRHRMSRLQHQIQILRAAHNPRCSGQERTRRRRDTEFELSL